MRQDRTFWFVCCKLYKKRNESIRLEDRSLHTIIRISFLCTGFVLVYSIREKWPLKLSIRVDIRKVDSKESETIWTKGGVLTRYSLRQGWLLFDDGFFSALIHICGLGFERSGHEARYCRH